MICNSPNHSTRNGESAHYWRDEQGRYFAEQCPAWQAAWRSAHSRQAREEKKRNDDSAEIVRWWEK